MTTPMGPEGGQTHRAARRPSRATIAVAIMVTRAVVAYALVASVLLTGTIRPAIVNFIALYWLLGSVLTLRWVSRRRGEAGWRLALLAGISGLVAAVVLLLRNVLIPLMSERSLVDIVAVAAIAIGSLRMVGAFRDDQLSTGLPRGRHRFLLGILDAMLGVGLLVVELGSPLIVGLLTIWAAVGGTLILADALALRRARRA